MPLDDIDFKEVLDDGEYRETQTTSVTFKNPDHEKVELDDDEEIIHKKEYYSAMKYLRSILGKDTPIVFGDFAEAVATLHEQGDAKPLHEVVEKLMKDNPPLKNANNPFTGEAESVDQNAEEYHDGYYDALMDVLGFKMRNGEVTQDDIKHLWKNNTLNRHNDITNEN